MKKVILVTLLSAVVLPFAGCAKKGPMEQAGEKVDETVRTIKNGGDKTPADKVGDAADDVKKGAEKAVDDVKKN